MSSSHESLFSVLKQGDLVSCTIHGQPILKPKECLFAVVSQTCDLRSTKREFVTLAPVLSIDKRDWSTIKKGRRPLMVPVGEPRQQAADMERLITVDRKTLADAKLIGHSVDFESGIEAAALASLLGRVFTKPALPDEVNEVFRKYSTKIADRYHKKNPVAKALDFLEDIRLECVDWASPGREITVHYLLLADRLGSSDLIDDSWNAGDDPEIAREFQMPSEHVTLEKVADRLCEAMDNGATLEAKYHFWELFVAKLHKEYIEPSLNEQVVFVEPVVDSADDFSYTLLSSSVSLDLTALSDTSELHSK